MKKAPQISKIIKFALPVILLNFVTKVHADSINFAHPNKTDVFQHVNTNASKKIQEYESPQLTAQENLDKIIFSSGQNNTQFYSEVFTESFLQLAKNEELGKLAGNASHEHADNTHVVKLPLPATVLLFGGAMTWLIGCSRRTHKLFGAKESDYANVLGIKFPNLNYERAISLFQQWIISREPHQVCFVNVHAIVSSLSNRKLHAINQNSLNAMDGVPVVWYAKLVFGKHAASKVCGPDLMLKCLDEGRKRDWKHYFLGSSEQVLKDLVVSMQNRFPGVEIVGWHSPAFRQLSDQEDAELVQLINDAKPDFLWVALGAPKQELWIADHIKRIQAPVQLGVGAAFNFHSGHIQRAPKWMQKSGLEWLYRIHKEKRLLNRYLTTNPVFMYLLIRDFIIIRLLKFKRTEYQ